VAEGQSDIILIQKYYKTTIIIIKDITNENVITGNVPHTQPKHGDPYV
jgi:hypothetical protein